MSRAAMQQALEALETWDDVDPVFVGETITALRAALAEPEQEPVFWFRPRSDWEYAAPIHNDRLDAVQKTSGGWVPLYTVPTPRKPEPEQESVAWRNAALRVGEDLCSVGPFGYYDMTAEQWLDWALSVVTVHEPPRPQAREPLTDGTLWEMWVDSLSDVLRFARAIERAHGIG